MGNKSVAQCVTGKHSEVIDTPSRQPHCSVCGFPVKLKPYDGPDTEPSELESFLDKFADLVRAFSALPEEKKAALRAKAEALSQVLSSELFPPCAHPYVYEAPAEVPVEMEKPHEGAP